jgi:hypothetical protein
MSKTYQIHVDTSSTSSNTVYKYDNNPFNCSVLLGQTHRRIRSVSLKSAEIPLGYYNVRAPYNIFTYTTVDGTTNITLTPGNYTSSSILSSINAGIGGSPLALNSGTNKVTYTNLSKTTTISAPPRSLASFLGFTDQQSGTTILATNSYNVSFDNYLCIYIENLRASSLEPNVPITFKIPITVSNTNIQTYSAGNQWEQKIEIYDPNIRIDRLNIRVLDRFGGLLNNNGIDWTFSLEIEADT